MELRLLPGLFLARCSRFGRRFRCGGSAAPRSDGYREAMRPISYLLLKHPVNDVAGRGRPARIRCPGWLVLAGIVTVLCGCTAQRTDDRSSSVTPVQGGTVNAPGDATERLAPTQSPGVTDSPGRRGVPARTPGKSSAAAPDARAPVDSSPQRIDLVPGVTVVRGGGAPARCEIDAIVCLNEGWLEQVACSPGTREHEAIFVIEAPARAIHTALLAAGFESGRPGQWTYDDSEGFQFHPPEGTPLRVLVRRADEPIDAARPVNEWIVTEESGETLPDLPFVFGGSRMIVRGVHFGQAAGDEDEEVYVADISGSLIGLVTFGDEVVRYQRVIADQNLVMPQEWVADSRRIPPIGTPVVLILEHFEAHATDADAPR